MSSLGRVGTAPAAGLLRRAFVMQLNPGCEAEYTDRHNPIWADLHDVLKAHGGHNYSIFLHADTKQLFGYVEIEDQARWDAVAETDVCQRWWGHMAPLMETNPDSSPVATPLSEVFHID